MAFGDMTYKFIDKNGEQQSEVIPVDYLRAGKRAGWTNKETIMRYLAEKGYAVDAPKETEKVKSRKRKPNEQKLDLINLLKETLTQKGNVTVVNPERQVQVEIDGKVFEFTLVQKRAPKK